MYYSKDILSLLLYYYQRYQIEEFERFEKNMLEKG